MHVGKTCAFAYDPARPILEANTEAPEGHWKADVSCLSRGSRHPEKIPQSKRSARGEERARRPPIRPMNPRVTSRAARGAQAVRSGTFCGLDRQETRHNRKGNKACHREHRGSGACRGRACGRQRARNGLMVRRAHRSRWRTSICAHLLCLPPSLCQVSQASARGECLCVYFGPDRPPPPQIRPPRGTRRRHGARARARQAARRRRCRRGAAPRPRPGRAPRKASTPMAPPRGGRGGGPAAPSPGGGGGAAVCCLRGRCGPLQGSAAEPTMRVGSGDALGANSVGGASKGGVGARHTHTQTSGASASSAAQSSESIGSRIWAPPPSHQERQRGANPGQDLWAPPTSDLGPRILRAPARASPKAAVDAGPSDVGGSPCGPGSPGTASRNGPAPRWPTHTWRRSTQGPRKTSGRRCCCDAVEQEHMPGAIRAQGFQRKMRDTSNIDAPGEAPPHGKNGRDKPRSTSFMPLFGAQARPMSADLGQCRPTSCQQVALDKDGPIRPSLAQIAQHPAHLG